eukprot:5366263-Pleurochrysis_carterae.AAC.2
MEADVALLKELGSYQKGSSWQSATRANTHSMLGITRGRAPCHEVRDVMMQSGNDTAIPTVDCTIYLAVQSGSGRALCRGGRAPCRGGRAPCISE